MQIQVLEDKVSRYICIMNKIIKVDRVQSVSEAIMLENLGVNLIGVSLANNPRFNDNRVVSKEIAREISKSLQNAKLVGEVDFCDQNSTVINLARDIGFDFLQPHNHNVPDIADIKILSSENIQMIYSYIEASHDSDPAWILSRFDENRYASREILNAAYFQIDVFSDFSDDAWNFIKHESPKYPEETQIADINQIAKDWPLLLSFNYSPENICEIINSFSDIKGISMVLADSVKCCSHHCDYSTAQKVLSKLKNSC